MIDPDMRHGSPDPLHTRILRAVGSCGLVALLTLGIIGGAVAGSFEFLAWCFLAGGVIFVLTALVDTAITIVKERP